MSSGKPKGRTPSLIGGTNGRPKRVPVLGGGRDCKRCHAVFSKGQTCIAIPQVGGGFASHKRVCETCFQAILKQTQDDLEALRTI